MNYYLLSWNPDKFNWSEFRAEIENSSSKCEAQWSVSNYRSIKSGDRFFMIKLGVDPRGLVAIGEFTSDPFEAPHWSGNGKTANYASIRYDFVADYNKPVIGIGELNRKFSHQHWSIQGSSSSISMEIASKVLGLWEKRVKNVDNIVIPIDNSHSILESAADRLSRGETISSPKGNANPQRVVVSGYTQIERDPKVVQYILQEAKGVCMLCEKPAPFQRAKNNQPYLEVHHITRLADGGPDTPENTVALCPNCHRRVHFGVDREKDISFLRKKKGCL